MKLKIVIKVNMPNAKSRSKALVLAGKANGVISIGITGDLKDRLEVTGEGVDITCLVCLLRKKLCHAEVVKVEEVKDDKKKDDEKKKDEAKLICACVGACQCRYVGYPLQSPMLYCYDEPPAGGCRIM